MKRIDPVLLQVLEEWQTAPWRGKKAVLARHLPGLGISEAAFYGLARRWGYLAERRDRADRGRLKDERREAWVKAIVQMKYRPPKGVRALTTEDARRLVAESWGDRGEAKEIMSLPVGTINRIARSLGLVETPRRENRFEAQYPNQAHQFDASGSEHFFPWKQEGEEWLLKLRPRRTKNKEKAERLRVLVYGLCDDFSGLRLARYTVAAGESALDGIRFLQWCWAAAPEHAPFQGWPEILYMDNGPVAKLGAFRRFCEGLGVRIQTHEPHRAQATGKVENNWRAAWKRFENLYFADPGWQGRVISLTELNQEFCRFWREWNQRPHRRLQISREEAWLLINRRGGPVSVAPEAWKHLAVQKERKLDNAGCFDLEGYTYQVRELWGCQVTVFRGLLDGSVWVQEEGGARRRFRAEPFRPQVWEEYRGVPKTALERLREEDVREAPPERPVFFPEGDGKVVHLVRPGEVRGSGQQSAISNQQNRGGGLDELLTGAEVVGESSPRRQDSEVYATPLERYAVVKVKQLSGKRLTPGEEEFLRQVEADYADQVGLLADTIAQRARLAAVE